MQLYMSHSIKKKARKTRFIFKKTNSAPEL